MNSLKSIFTFKKSDIIFWLLFGAIAYYMVFGFTFYNPFSTSKGIAFENITFSQALEKAKQEDKIIFIDAYTTWCGPCKMMKKTVFPVGALGKFYNKNFINLAIDMEKNEGPTLAQMFDVRAYPTLIFINQNGQVVLHEEGYKSAGRLIEMGEEVLNKTR